MKRELRETERKVLEILKENARVTYSDIGKRIGLSRTAVKNAVDAMERDGFILGYKVITDTKSEDGKLTCLINVFLSEEHLESVKDVLCNLEETVSVMQTSGKSALFAVCRTDIGKVRDFISRIYKIEGVIDVSTQAVLDVVKGEI